MTKKIDRPIIFSAPMIHALLDGRKTQTRRVAYGPWIAAPDMDSETQEHFDVLGHIFDIENGTVRAHAAPTPWARTKVGWRLWVREAHAIYVAHGQHREDGRRWGPWGGLPTTISPDRDRIAYYREGFDRSFSGRWKPSIHMPRWASRLTLVVTRVKVERLNEISEEDARAEGCVPEEGSINPNYLGPARSIFHALWDELHGAGSWDANPFVVAITFAVHKANIDAMEKAA